MAKDKGDAKKTAGSIKDLLSACLLVTLLGLAFGRGCSPESKPADANQPTPPPAGRALDQKLQTEILQSYLADPVNEYGWHASSPIVRETNFRYDFSEGKPVYVFNATYMEELDVAITSGTATSLFADRVLEAQTSEDAAWRQVRDTGTANQWQLANANSIRLGSHYGPLSGPDHVLSVHLLAKRNDPASIVIGTDTVIKAGEAKTWGTVFTELRGRKLTGEMTIVFLREDGSPIPLDLFVKVKEPPTLWIGEMDYWVSAPVIRLALDQAYHGELLEIRTGQEFCNCLVLVNFLLK